MTRTMDRAGLARLHGTPIADHRQRVMQIRRGGVMCMADYSDDQPSFYRAKTCLTRKTRKCAECGRAIAIGERYQNTFMVYAGKGDTFVTCEHCVIGMEWLKENCGGFLHTGVWEDLEEHIQKYRRLAFPLSRLKVARRRHWKRFDGAGLMSIPPIPPTLEMVGLT